MKLVAPEEETQHPPRNTQGRPVVPRLEDTKQTWTFSRPSGAGKPLLDSTMIEHSYRRKMLRGVGIRPSLGEIAVPLDIREDKAELDDLVAQAGFVGGDGVQAEQGTSLHKVWERYLHTGTAPTVTEDNAPAVNAVIELMERHDLSAINEHWVEPVCINYPLKYTGSFDFGSMYDGEATIVDFKTSQYEPTDYDNPISHSTQLAVYATSTHFWREGEQPEPIPLPINKQFGFIIWAPHGGDFARLYRVDLVRGLELVELATQVKEARSATGKKGITTLVPDLHALDDAALSSKQGQGPDSEQVEMSPSAQAAPVDPDPAPPGPSATVADSESVAGRDGGGSNLATRIGRLRVRLTTLVDRSECGIADVRQLQIANDLKTLKNPDAQTEESIECWESILATLELAHGIEPPKEERLENIKARVIDLPTRWYDKLGMMKADTGIPNLRRTDWLFKADLDKLDPMLIGVELEAAKEADRRRALLKSFSEEERRSLIEWAGGDKGTPLLDLDELGEQRLEALCLMYEHPDEVEDPMSALLDIHETKKALLNVGRDLAKRHDLPAPTSSKDVAGTKVLAALALNTPKVKET